jgi:hypothetical protein
VRLATALLFLLGLAALAVAAYAGNPLWRGGLYASTGLFSLSALALLAAALETRWEDQVPLVRGGLALAAEVTAFGLSRLRPLGSLPERPLLHLEEAALSVAGLALCLGGLALGALALRSGSRGAAVLSGLALLGALLALGAWLAQLS